MADDVSVGSGTREPNLEAISSAWFSSSSSAEGFKSTGVEGVEFRSSAI
jgi:uncharacterized protein YbbC (DUF1343 family)